MGNVDKVKARPKLKQGDIVKLRSPVSWSNGVTAELFKICDPRRLTGWPLDNEYSLVTCKTGRIAPDLYKLRRSHLDGCNVLS